MLLTVPTSPRSVSLDSVDITSALLSWQPPLSANGIIQGYSVRHYSSSRGRQSTDGDDDDEVPVIVVDQPSTLRYNVTGLQPYTNYQLQVVMAASLEGLAWWDWWPFTWWTDQLLSFSA